MHCKSLWIKASAKCINVNVNVIWTSSQWIVKPNYFTFCKILILILILILLSSVDPDNFS